MDETGADLKARLAGYRPQVERHIGAMVHDAAEAEELTQETYARALEHLDGLRDPQAGLAWLYRIATNVTLDRLRRRLPTSVPLDELVLNDVEQTVTPGQRRTSPIEGELQRAEMSTCVQGYLERLPDDYRVAILLHDGHGLSNPETAELVGCSLATAKIRVHRARLRLRAALEAACVFGTDERGVLGCEPDPQMLSEAS